MNKVKNILVTLVAVLAATGVAINLPMEFSWAVTGACLAGVGLSVLVLKNIIYDMGPDKLIGVVAAVGVAIIICGISGLIPLAIIYYPTIPTIVNIYGLAVIWSIEITLLCIIIHDGFPNGILGYVIGSIMVFWGGVCITCLGITALQPVLQVVIAGSLIVFSISFIIWGFKSIKSK